MLKNKCCLYVIISIWFFSIAICNLLIEFPSYEYPVKKEPSVVRQKTIDSSYNVQRNVTSSPPHRSNRLRAYSVAVASTNLSV